MLKLKKSLYNCFFYFKFIKTVYLAYILIKYSDWNSIIDNMYLVLSVEDPEILEKLSEEEKNFKTLLWEYKYHIIFIAAIITIAVIIKLSTDSSVDIDIIESGPVMPTPGELVRSEVCELSVSLRDIYKPRPLDIIDQLEELENIIISKSVNVDFELEVLEAALEDIRNLFSTINDYEISDELLEEYLNLLDKKEILETVKSLTKK